MSKYDLALEIAEEALAALIVGEKDRATGSEMFEWIKQNRPDAVADIQSSWGSWLTRATEDPASRIMREPGKYGYMLRPDGPPPAADVAPVEAPNEPVAVTLLEEVKRVEREKRLYNLLVEWLLAKDIYASDTSASKKGGAWGNPDVVGIRIEEGVGGISHLEITTIEAKLTDRDWRRVFFEAVSHKRFADRVYFAFSFPSVEAVVSQLPEFAEYREYGEKYGVGILVVFMEPKAHETLVSGTTVDALKISLDDVRVEEVWPAIHDPVSLFTRDRFLREVLEVNTMKDLYEFGQ